MLEGMGENEFEMHPQLTDSKDSISENLALTGCLSGLQCVADVHSSKPCGTTQRNKVKELCARDSAADAAIAVFGTDNPGMWQVQRQVISIFGPDRVCLCCCVSERENAPTVHGVADEEEQLAIVSTGDVFLPPVHVAVEMSFQLAVHT